MAQKPKRNVWKYAPPIFLIIIFQPFLLTISGFIKLIFFTNDIFSRETINDVIISAALVGILEVLLIFLFVIPYSKHDKLNSSYLILFCFLLFACIYAFFMLGAVQRNVPLV